MRQVIVLKTLFVGDFRDLPKHFIAVIIFQKKQIQRFPLLPVKELLDPMGQFVQLEAPVDQQEMRKRLFHI
jgi:hypothetical protein